MTNIKKMFSDAETRLRFILGLCSIMGLLVIWIALSKLYPVLLPSPLKVIERWYVLSYDPIGGYGVTGHVFASLRRVFIALFASIIVGIPLGVSIGWNKIASKTLGVLFELIRPIPPLAWLPLIIMLLGIGELPKIVMVFIGTLMPITINSYTGIKNSHQELFEVAESFNATEMQVLTKVAIPSALPSIMAGIRNSVGVGWMVVLAAEMIGAKEGVGFLITRGTEFFDVPLIMVGMISIGIVGAILSFAVEKIERRICPWAYRAE